MAEEPKFIRTSTPIMIILIAAMATVMVQVTYFFIENRSRDDTRNIYYQTIVTLDKVQTEVASLEERVRELEQARKIDAQQIENLTQNLSKVVSAITPSTKGNR